MCDRYKYINCTCACEDGCGGVNDLVLLRERDCLMDERWMYFIYAACIILYLSMLVASFIVIRESAGLCLIMLRVWHASIVISFAFVMNVFLNGFVMTGFGFVLYMGSIRCTFCVVYIVVYLYTSRIGLSAGSSKEMLRNALLLQYLLFNVLECLPAIVAAIFYQDHLDMNNDHPWNLCICAFSMFIFVEIFALIISTYVRTSKSMYASHIPDGNASSVSNDVDVIFERTLKRYINFISVGGVALLLCYSVSSILYLVTGYVPYSFLFFSVSYMLHVILSFLLVFIMNHLTTNDANKIFCDPSNESDKNSSKTASLSKMPEKLNSSGV